MLNHFKNLANLLLKGNGSEMSTKDVRISRVLECITLDWPNRENLVKPKVCPKLEIIRKHSFRGILTLFQFGKLDFSIKKINSIICVLAHSPDFLCACYIG